MKKQVEIERDPDMLDEYDFSQGVRGEYVQRFAQGSNVVVLSPDVAEIFPDCSFANLGIWHLQNQGKDGNLSAG